MQIAFVAYDDFTALDMVGPLEVLGRVPGFSPVVVANTQKPVISDTGALQIQPERDLDDVEQPAVVLVPGGTAGTRAAMRDRRLLEWLAAAAERAVWMTSVCTGSLVLGAAGLLEDRKATTHWAVMDELTQHRALPTEERFVVDGRVVTAAGVSAGIDMALWLASQLTSEEVAKLLQLVIEYNPNPPFDAGSPRSAEEAATALARAAIEASFDQPPRTAGIPR